MDTVLLKIKDIKGNSTLDGATDQIVLYSYSIGVSISMNRDVGNTERTMGRPSFQEFSLSKVEHGMVSAASLAGILVGAVGLGGLSDRFGRRSMFIAESFCFFGIPRAADCQPEFSLAGNVPVRSGPGARVRLSDRAPDDFREHS